MKLITTISHYSTIHTGDVISHPVYGRLRVDCITRLEEDNIEMMCCLLDFNNTLKSFDGLDMIRIKYGRKTILKVVR